MFFSLIENSQLDDFSFIANWNRLSEDEQMSKFDEFTCHELNFFLYKKDPQFFKEVVIPFIRNKTHKTFMDFFLLQDIEALKKYIRIDRFNSLNYLEKVCFLILLFLFGTQSLGLQVLLAASLKDKEFSDKEKKFYDDKNDTIKINPRELDQ